MQHLRRIQNDSSGRDIFKSRSKVIPDRYNLNKSSGTNLKNEVIIEKRPITANQMLNRRKLI